MTGGRISEKTIQSCKDYLDFARCERPDGTAYGTSGECRKGRKAEKDPEENRRLVREALKASPEEFNSKFYPIIEGILNGNAEDFEERASSTPRSKLSESDNVKITAARRLAIIAEDYQELKGTNAKAAAKLKTTKEFFDDMKWRLPNDQVLITEGTLRAIWDGKDIAKNARDIFPEEAQKVKFGQSKGSIAEHSHPTSVLKDNILNRRFKSPSEMASFIMKRNFLTWVAGPEDGRMTEAGLRSTTPDPNDIFSRYKASKIKALPIRRNNGMMSLDDQGLNVPKWLNNAKEARERGESFEDWVTSVIEF